MFSRPGTVVEVSSPDEGLSGARFEAVLIRPPSSKKRRREALVEYKTLLSDDGSPAPLREWLDLSCLRPQPPEEAQDSFELHEVVDAFHNDGWWTGVVNAVLDQSYSVLFQNPPDQRQFTNWQLRPHLDWIDGKWVRPQKAEPEYSVVGGLESEQNNIYRKRGRPRKIAVKSVQDSGLHCQEIRTSQQNDKVENSQSPVGHRSMEPKHSIVGGPELEQNNFYRKRGRPRKIAVKSVQDSGLHCQEIRTSQQNDKVANSQSSVGHRSMEGTTENDNKPLVKCERRLDDVMATEAGETNGAETGFMANALRDVALASCCLYYHQPLSKQGHEDAHPPSTGGDPNGDATQDMSMVKKTGDTTPKAALPLGEAAADTQQHGSCVMKRSPLWKTIEAMEAFQALPQNPHFRPLLDCQEEIREGLAIGNMVAFVSLVEKASHLRFDDPISTLDSIFAGLVELEAHGFDVEPVQHRVIELLSIKLSSEQLTKQSEVVEARIREHHQKKAEIDGEINEIERMMEELEMKQSEALVKWAAWDSAAGLLKSELDGIGEEMRLAALKFERMVAGL